MVKLRVKTRPNSKRSALEQVGERTYAASLKSPPIGGKANEELISLVAEYFGVAKSDVDIVSGLKSREKVVSVS